jgi:hypothetical protein
MLIKTAQSRSEGRSKIDTAKLLTALLATGAVVGGGAYGIKKYNEGKEKHNKAKLLASLGGGAALGVLGAIGSRKGQAKLLNTIRCNLPRKAAIKMKILGRKAGVGHREANILYNAALDSATIGGAGAGALLGSRLGGTIVDKKVEHDHPIYSTLNKLENSITRK